MLEATVYILRCADGSYYTGLTKQPIESRVWEHNEGIYEGFTKRRRPVTLVFTETYDRMLDAIAREKQIKGWSRAKKEALIALDYKALPALSRNRQEQAVSTAPSPFPHAELVEASGKVPAYSDTQHASRVDPSTGSG
ncbi:GIY-YIG nuclease family protein [Aureimonas leprariae]|uniref:GIY-YIG nuclease family protein n=1 Tax=Plantimonas leprariae TaxID=2615207 RepID=A0A7V7PRC6_9HYPH|nr:GIY-YIG nuclease family protein [Aureimonas leprariae]